MSIPDLEAFVAVVETGSIVSASTRLNLTQPGVTRRVQNLENSLGIALLDRQSKPLKPTSAGREAYEHGRRVLRSMEDLRASITPGGPISGEFRLGINPYFSGIALESPIDRLRADFPKLTLHITAGWSPLLLGQVVRSELDAAVVGLNEGIHPPEDLAAENLAIHNVILVGSRDLKIPRPASLRDLSRFPWIMNQDGCGFRSFIRRSFEAANLPFQVGIETMNPDQRLRLVARGHGIGIVTPSALAKSPFADALQKIDAPEFRPQIRAWLIHRPPAGRLARPIATFRAALLDELKAENAA